MIGKKNIVFGFIYLAATAALGAVMILGYFDERRIAGNLMQEKVSILQQIAFDNYERDLEPVAPIELAKANTEAILAISTRTNVQKPINNIRFKIFYHLLGRYYTQGNIIVRVNPGRSQPVTKKIVMC